VRGAVRLRFRQVGGAPISELALERLPLFLRGSEQLGMRLYELIRGGALGLLLRDGSGARTALVPGDAVRGIGFEDDQALLPYGPRSFQGYRLLHEYFALPARYLFVELAELGPGVRACQSSELEIVILLDRNDPTIEPLIAPEHFELFCTPAINLFPRKADRIHLNDRENEYHVVPDRTRPLDFEVHSITEVIGFGTSTTAQREFLPFYECTERSAHDDAAAYYVVHRQQRLASTRRGAGSRSTYPGG
jgi:type VI secretion system protein ImpG